MFNQAFKTTQDRHGISATRLNELTGIAASTISNYRCGKRDLKVETLERLLEGMERLSPGALNDFASEIGKVEVSGLSSREKQILIWSLPEHELAELLRLIGDRLAKTSEKTLATSRRS